MTTITDTFTLDAIQAQHQDRIHEIDRLLLGSPDPASPTSSSHKSLTVPLRYALAHHFLEGAEKAARDGNEQLLSWYRTNGSRSSATTAAAEFAGEHLLMTPSISALMTSAISETPFYVLNPGFTKPEPELVGLLRRALECASESGFESLVRNHGPVICLLQHKNLGETLDSWTITRLPGTVFVDYVDSPEILARDLIHEAGHNWLNDAFTSLSIEIPSDQSFYSPWKGTPRPAFGFIHACWSFPLTVLHSSQMLGTASEDVREFLRAYLSQQRPLLQEARSSFENAVQLIPHVDLQHRIRSVYDAACSV